MQYEFIDDIMADASGWFDSATLRNVSWICSRAAPKAGPSCTKQRSIG